MATQLEKRQVPGPVLVPEEQQGMPGWMWGALIAAFVGMVLALVMIPVWVPTLGASIVGADPKFYWYLSRASAMVAFGLLWVSMASGLIITNKMARIWPGAFTAFDLHQFTSLLGLGFAAFHALILLGNAFVPYSLVQIVVPFGNDAYRQIMGGDRASGDLFVGAGERHVLYAEADRHQGVAGDTYVELWFVWVGAAAWGVRGHGLGQRVDIRDVLVQCDKFGGADGLQGMGE